jgi:cytoskeletal protein RodZ
MKTSIIKPHFALLALAALLSACSSSPDTSASNSNAAQQANSNSNQQAQAQNETPSPTTETPLRVQPIPAPSPPAGSTNTNAASGTATAGARQPKLIAPEKKLDFGKQPQDKTIVRAIHIKNAGQAALNIESVTPS